MTVRWKPKLQPRLKSRPATTTVRRPCSGSREHALRIVPLREPPDPISSQNSTFTGTEHALSPCRQRTTRRSTISSGRSRSGYWRPRLQPWLLAAEAAALVAGGRARRSLNPGLISATFNPFPLWLFGGRVPVCPPPGGKGLKVADRRRQGEGKRGWGASAGLSPAR
jgi:hypothetical protein